MLPMHDRIRKGFLRMQDNTRSPYAENIRRFLKLNDIAIINESRSQTHRSDIALDNCEVRKDFLPTLKELEIVLRL